MPNYNRSSLKINWESTTCFSILLQPHFQLVNWLNMSNLTFLNYNFHDISLHSLNYQIFQRKLKNFTGFNFKLKITFAFSSTSMLNCKEQLFEANEIFYYLLTIVTLCLFRNKILLGEAYAVKLFPLSPFFFQQKCLYKRGYRFQYPLDI